MEEKSKKIWIGAVIIAVIGLGAGLWYSYYQRPGEVPSPKEEPGVEKPSAPAQQEALREAAPISPPAEPRAGVPLPVLDQSDDYARKVLRGLSSHTKIRDWLKIENIIRIITAAVDNIAGGLSPRSHLGFLSSQQVFGVHQEGRKLYLDPKSYERYDLIADVFATLDATKTVRVYGSLKPLFQQAYRELGYPDRDFQDTLIRAIQVLLRTPLVEREILVEEMEKGLNYRIVDGDLEGLTEAQKHLLRMGPKNARKIQKKLAEIALALGVPEDQIPKTQVYVSK